MLSSFFWICKKFFSKTMIFFGVAGAFPRSCNRMHQNFSARHFYQRFWR